MNQRSASGFAELAHRILVHEGGRTLKEVAAELDMSYHTFYARLRGRAAFSPEEIRALIGAVSDLRLANYLLDETGYIAVEQVQSDGPIIDDLHRGATRSVIEATDVLRTVERSLANNRIDHLDKINIRREIDEAEQALAALRTRLESL